MNLNEQIAQQIQVFLQDAPDDPEMRQITETFIPVLTRISSKLRYSEYHILHTQDQEWVSFTLTHRTQSHVEKTVIYAFSSPEDVRLSISAQDLSELSVVSIGIIPLLFQFFSLNLGDAIVFFEPAGNIETGVEISRTEFEQELRRLLDPPSANLA
jgi:hypothetical protein